MLKVFWLFRFFCPSWHWFTDFSYIIVRIGTVIVAVTVTDFLKFVFILLDIGPAPRNFLLDPLNFCRTYIFLCKIVLN